MPNSLRLKKPCLGFPGSSAGKESTCNAGDPNSILRWGSSDGERIDCLLQHSWASVVAQVIKNPLAMWETWVQSLGWKDPLEEGMATHSSILFFFFNLLILIEVYLLYNIVMVFATH